MKDVLRGWRSIHITDSDHPYMKHWWVPGLQIGYEHTFIHQFADFLVGLGDGTRTSPTFRDGLATDCVTDAVLKSAKTPPVGNDSRGTVNVARWPTYRRFVEPLTMVRCLAFATVGLSRPVRL